MIGIYVEGKGTFIACVSAHLYVIHLPRNNTALHVECGGACSSHYATNAHQIVTIATIVQGYIGCCKGSSGNVYNHSVAINGCSESVPNAIGRRSHVASSEHYIRVFGSGGHIGACNGSGSTILKQGAARTRTTQRSQIQRTRTVIVGRLCKR